MKGENKISDEDYNTALQQKKGIYYHATESTTFTEALKEFERTGTSSNSILNSILLTLNRISESGSSVQTNYATESQN